MQNAAQFVFSPPLGESLNIKEFLEGLSLVDTSFYPRDSPRPLNKTCRVTLFHWSYGGCAQFVHGRSRMTVDPRFPTMPGRSTSGFHQPGRRCLHQARSAVRCSASRMRRELQPSKNRSLEGLRHLVPTFLLMGDSAKVTLFSGVTSPGTAMGITM